MNKTDISSKTKELIQSLNLSPYELGHIKWEGLERLIPLIITHISAKTTAYSVLDVGCGDGTTAYCLKHILNAEVTGIDCDPESLKRAEGKGIKTVSLNLETDRFPFPDRTFSHITLIEVLEHLAKPEHCLSEIARVLNADGEFILTTPNLASLGNILTIVKGKDPVSGMPYDKPCDRHIRLYAKNSVTTLLLNFFKNVKVDYCNCAWAYTNGNPNGKYTWKVFGRNTLCIFKKDWSGQIVVKCRKSD